MLAGLNNPGWRMNVGKTLFAQVMEFVPWKTFGRIILFSSVDRLRLGANVDLARV